ncbi:MAG: ABC transporter ATP-binding protein [Thaumarchaeota archaeon]|nr:ABC transporter ATP-binding protein [Nitrososphaerota archaeon]
MTKILSVKGVTRSFGALKALDDISLDVEEKSLTVLIGPNGSGKTTLINVIDGYYKPNSGEVWFRGKNITGWAPHEIFRVGLTRTFQIPSLFLELTILENLLVSSRNHPGESFLRSLIRQTWIDAESKYIHEASKILEILGLARLWDKPTATLSGGQMKLLEIGRALMSNPTMLLLDEPVSGVNPTLAHEIFARLIKLRDELGVTFLIVEHRLDVALEYADQVEALAYGKPIASGPPEDVMVNPKVIESYLGA